MVLLCYLLINYGITVCKVVSKNQCPVAHPSLRIWLNPKSVPCPRWVTVPYLLDVHQAVYKVWIKRGEK